MFTRGVVMSVFEENQDKNEKKLIFNYPNKIVFLDKSIPVPLAGIWSENLNDGLDLALVLTNRCNSKCSHCYNESGDKHISEISPNKIEKLIERGNIFGVPISRVGLSGGDPLLYKDIARISRKIVDKNILLSCITGGVGVPMNKIEELASAGVCRLTISYDMFHAKHISENRIFEIVNRASEIFPEVAIQIVSQTRGEGIKAAHKLIQYVNNKVEIAIAPLLGIGRAKNIIECSNQNEGQFQVEVGKESILKKITIDYDEKVYSNCEIDGFCEQNVVGDLDELIKN